MDKKYRCLFFDVSGCQWQGSVPEVVHHFISAHKTSYKPHPINVEINEGTLYQFLTVVFNRVFFVQVKANASLTIECLVKCVHVYNAAQFGICEFCIKSDYDGFVCSRQGVVYGLNYPNKMQLLNFHLEGIRYKRPQSSTKIICIISKLNSSDIHLIPIYTHNYSLEKEFENDHIPQSLANLTSAASEWIIKWSQFATTFLKELECPVCMNYMNAPIFNCSTGHSFCQDCKTKLDVCPICRSKLTNARNYVLENLIRRLQYPCIHATYGCEQILNLENVKQHIDKCLYKVIKCPFPTCDRQVCLLAVSEHFEKDHSAMLFQDNQLLSKCVSTPSVSYNSTILYNDDVFVLGFECEHEMKSLRIDCIHIITAEDNEKNNYTFELQFESQVDGNLKFAVNRYCKKSFTMFEGEILILPLQLLKPFIRNKIQPTLYFKCLINRA